jgi:hypothetical protein
VEVSNRSATILIRPFVVEQNLDFDSTADASKVDPPVTRPFVPYDVLDLDPGTTTRVTENLSNALPPSK